LTEWLRVLKDGGEIRLAASDIRFVAKEVAEGRLDPSILYSGKRRTSFDFERLKKLLEQRDLKVERVQSDAAHIAVRGRKSNGLG
jgi:hypothetical protein